MPDPTMPRLGPTPPSWGWPGQGLGRAAHAACPPLYQATTVQGCGLYPFTAGSGAPAVGVPIGRHMIWGEVVALDPVDWVRANLATNPGVFVLGEPGVGKSAFSKRMAVGLAAFGTGVVVLGDLKGEYGGLVTRLGGQVVRIGWGLDRLNPLDSGALGQAVTALDGTSPERARALRAEIRSRRLDLLLALCLIARGSRGAAVTDAEELALGGALDLLARDAAQEPVIPQVMHVIETGDPEMCRAVLARSPQEYRELTDGILRTLARICQGLLQGLFDGPTTTPADLSAPAVSLDIHALDNAADDIVAAALLCTWAYGFGAIDAARAVGDTRHYLTVQDEMWRSLRAAPGLVERTDRLTRLNRQKGIGSIITTHSLSDLEALPTAEDQAKARGLVERSAITVMGALPDLELGRVHQVRSLTTREREMVASWSAPESWETDRPHPGRGKYLIKNAGRLGIPVEMHLTPGEIDLYNTDTAIRRQPVARLPV
ncbi:hypothetical protein DVA86_20390 [Streptomyces armeniacus]|uniref:ATP-binding protein n=1 Tax=Streptomyces armeniacus TaxID=83291 RepID=A0A345XSN9_9ACTN|nr:hypothetical protein [Streptomyces armeniacus]AXK34655.1 hypothetical protein DVA86_20390 [Streptomyces armeniacus]